MLFAVMLVPHSMINLAYGFLLRDWWIAGPHISGVCLGFYYSLIMFRALPLQRFRFYALLTPLLLLTTILLSSAAIIQLNPTDPASAKTLMGISSVVFITGFYSAPLSSLWGVIKEKDSSSIHIPLSLVMLLNAMFWAAYGISLGNPFVWGPNVLGMASAVAQILLALVFPRAKSGGKSWMTIRGKRLWKTFGRSKQQDVSGLEAGVVVDLAGEDGKRMKGDDDTQSERTEALSERVDTPSPESAGMREV